MEYGLVVVKYSDPRDGKLLDKVKADFETPPMLKLSNRAEDLNYMQKGLRYLNHRPGTTVINYRTSGGKQLEVGRFHGAEIDFTKYQHMTPEGESRNLHSSLTHFIATENARLNQMYANDTFVFFEWEINIPTPTAQRPENPDIPYEISFYYDNLEHPLQIEFTKEYIIEDKPTLYTVFVARTFHMYDEPVLRDFAPMKGPTQGGTAMTVLGSIPHVAPITDRMDWTQTGFHQSAVGTINVTMPLIKFETPSKVSTIDETGFGECDIH